MSAPRPLRARWYKHYVNAYQGEVFQRLEPEFGLARAYGLYWLLVDYCSAKWDGVSDPTFVVSKKFLANFLGLKMKTFSLFLKTIENETDLFFKENENILEINFPKLLEIRHRDSFSSGQRPAKSRPNPGLDKRREDKIREDSYVEAKASTTGETRKSAAQRKKKATGSNTSVPRPESFEEMLALIPENTKTRWRAIYPDQDEWVARELQKAFGYYAEDNPQRCPKSVRGWCMALSSWLERGWMRTSRNYQGSSQMQLTSYEKIQRGLMVLPGGEA